MNEIWYIRIAGFLIGCFIVILVENISHKNFDASLNAIFVIISSILLARAELKISRLLSKEEI